MQSSVIPAMSFSNIAEMLAANQVRFGEKPAYLEKINGTYKARSWNELFQSVRGIAYHLKTRFGFKPGDKMVLYSPNRYEMLLLELAVMSSGGIAVPIFAFFHTETAELLIRHSDAGYVAVAGDVQLSRIPNVKAKNIFVFDPYTGGKENIHSFDALLQGSCPAEYILDPGCNRDTICLNMYTSGTMGVPKCVQLTHGNILSQQEGLAEVWSLTPEDRFLSYLPWHHSFGGIFELFSALYNGAPLALESGYGKDAKEIFTNWKLIKPTVFFSVPKVYQALIELTQSDQEARELLFHSQLKFVFTAAASLPKNISDVFEKAGIPVMEGWGLTETSPCCTVTNPDMKRSAGVVGFPLPGITLRLNDDKEIQVKGPNVMKGYYKNDAANKDAFTSDGWFCTGDIGEITDVGLKLISRKDRVFKLSNGEKVIPTDLEKIIELKCHYVSFAMVVGNGKEYPVALIFPNKKLVNHPDYQASPEEGCFCPRNLQELSRCLMGCLHDANCGIGQKFSKIKSAMIIDDELSIENETITPSMKVAPNKVSAVYKAHIENLYGAKNEINEDVYVVRLDQVEPSLARKITG